GGIPIRFRTDLSEFSTTRHLATREQLQLHLTHTRLQLLRGFDELLCLEGLTGVEHLPHQIETVRKVMRRFRGRVLLADEVGLGKTIEACLLLREYLLRRLIKRVLILVPNPLVSQWHEELSSKFHLDFKIAPRTATSSRDEFWATHDRVLVSTSFARTGRRPQAIASAQWDLVIVDEAHHCRNRATKLWKLVNSLQRRHMFLLTATPVQNNLVELYSLLTLLEPGHLKTEADFKKQFVTRGNPRDPRNRHRLRDLLGEVMIRNTRGLVQINLPPRYAQTIIATPGEEESQLLIDIQQYLRDQLATTMNTDSNPNTDDTEQESPEELDASSPESADTPNAAANGPAGISRMRLHAILTSLGSHPATAAATLQPLAERDDRARQLCERAGRISHSAKDEKLLQLLKESHDHKVLIFVASIRTLHRLQSLLTEAAISFSTFSGEQSSTDKDAAVEQLKSSVNVMLCTESGGEGRNLQFADTLINFDLPWNPMKIEQRIGRIHRFGQTQDVFIFNLCTAGTLESRILKLLNDKIRMFELVVGEVGSILGNLDDGQEFESLVLQLWQKAPDDKQLDADFETLGDTLVAAQEKYLDAKNLDEALFGEDYE
ncbi:MAG: DEAD/DEAH box helicase, partial [Fuerstia sp.]|nr:DEAD/DEAH box helicase [Fuerstiella sp.]